MRIDVNQSRCEGYGFCEQKAPELLALDPDGFVTVLADHVDGSQVDAARRAVRGCPVAALTLVE
ncbi:ferredoxin [Amycolatopsis mongoliensis]|uniref:Ferredoxin n=1 Tax=Amycolatopsis mongoliensis TaxID=715475 RepID=A0A9Y2JP76_9PSEU|nr:ferredoxin [Amycolatopsis sp. 4-36]WIY01086.1 ferredoxin [Amycolatopsis sp. 4-36]